MPRPSCPREGADERWRPNKTLFSFSLGQYLYRLSRGVQADYRRAAAGAREFVHGDEKVARTRLCWKLWRYLNYCKEFSGFWRERWPREWETFSPDEAPAVLAALPCVGKEELRKYGQDLRLRSERRHANGGFPCIHKQFMMSSGGSTGMPTVVWQDRGWNAANRAMVDFGHRKAGLEPGSPTFYIWGSSNELSELRGSCRKRVSTRLRGLIPMPAFSMNESRMREFMRLIDRRRDVENALCFVTALDTLTDYIARGGRSVRRLRRVITGGGTLYPELRQRVLDVLADEVFDLYGSRDMGIIAIETREHKGLAALQWHNYVEVLDTDLQRCKPGETGRIYVTALENHSTALIRMDMGDMATVGSGHDLDWRWTVLKRLTGRAAEHLLAPDGSIIEPAAVIHLIGVLIRPDWLKKFQVIQRRMDDFEVRVEVCREVSEGDMKEFVRRVTAAMTKLCSCEVSVEVRVVARIVTSPSGKHFYCVSMMRPSGGGRRQEVSAGDNK